MSPIKRAPLLLFDCCLSPQSCLCHGNLITREMEKGDWHTRSCIEEGRWCSSSSLDDQRTLDGHFFILCAHTLWLSPSMESHVSLALAVCSIENGSISSACQSSNESLVLLASFQPHFMASPRRSFEYMYVQEHLLFYVHPFCNCAVNSISYCSTFCWLLFHSHYAFSLFIRLFTLIIDAIWRWHGQP